MSHNGSHIAAPTVAVAYHSGFGHTAVLADAVASGARDAGAHVTVVAVDAMTDADWDVLDGADAIVFGSATYMGNVSAAFQAFAEQTGRRCFNGAWRDKVAAGFTNSGAKSGDKMHTLTSLAVFAAQHHMHWVNLGLGAGWNTLDRLARTTSTGWASSSARRADRRRRRTARRAFVRCQDMPPSRPTCRAGDAAAQPRSSGFISCSIVGTSSLTVGWMCIVREIAV